MRVACVGARSGCAHSQLAGVIQGNAGSVELAGVLCWLCGGTTHEHAPTPREVTAAVVLTSDARNAQIRGAPANTVLYTDSLLPASGLLQVEQTEATTADARSESVCGMLLMGGLRVWCMGYV